MRALPVGLAASTETPRRLTHAGVPLKVVSERLGHSTPAFTKATYQHVLPGMQAEPPPPAPRCSNPAFYRLPPGKNR